MISLTPTPSEDTWEADNFISASWLNANVRDVQKFLAHAPLTIVTRAATQSIPNAQDPYVAVTWDTEVIDIDGMFSNPSSVLIVRRPAVYAIEVQVPWAANASGSSNYRTSRIAINGVAVSKDSDQAYGSVYGPSNVTSTVMPLNTDDQLSVLVFQSSGASLNIGGTLNGPRLAVRAVSTANIDLDLDGIPTGTISPPPSKPPTQPNPTKYSKTYYATWSRTYDGDWSTTWDDTAHCYQGRYSSDRGSTRSLVGFNASSIKSDLSGATNIVTKLTFTVAHSYWNAGMTVVPTWHNYTSKPSSWSDANVWNLGCNKSGCAPGHTYTITLPRAAGTGLKQGSIKGFGFGPAPNTSLTYYGYLRGATEASKPKLTITYTK